MPAKDMQWVIEGKTIPWYQADVHWYIVGGQHTYQACVSIAKKEVPLLEKGGNVTAGFDLEVT